MAIESNLDKSKSNETYINVISSITGSAASQVDGVVSVTYGNGKKTKIGRKTSVKNKAIDVVIYDNRLVKIEISVNIYYGYVIPVVVCKLQEKIKHELIHSAVFRNVLFRKLNMHTAATAHTQTAITAICTTELVKRPFGKIDAR